VNANLKMAEDEAQGAKEQFDQFIYGQVGLLGYTVTVWIRDPDNQNNCTARTFSGGAVDFLALAGEMIKQYSRGQVQQAQAISARLEKLEDRRLVLVQ